MNLDNLRLEKFVGFGAKMSRKISITKNLSFGFPPAFYSENSLDDYNFVELYFDAKQNTVAFHFIEKKSDACFKLIKYGEGDKRGGTFVAKSFFTRYDIDPQKVSGKYEYKKLVIGGLGLFTIEIKEHPVINL